MIVVFKAVNQKDLAVAQLTFDPADLTRFCRLEDVGLVATGQIVTEDEAVIECRMAVADNFCGGCGAQGRVRDSERRRIVHVPFGHRPTYLLIRVRRYACGYCHRVWRQDISNLVAPRQKLTRAALYWALVSLVEKHMSVSQIAKSLGVAWHTVNDAVLEEARTALFSDPARLEGVRVVGVDEHVWTHKRRSKFVTVIIDLTPVRDQRGPARLLDVVEGRTKAALQQWLHERPQGWRDGVEFVAMDGFTGYKTAAAEELPNAVAVMDPFHVVHLAADGLEKTRQRVQQDVYGHRGRAGEPLYGHRRIMLTGWPLLGDRQQDRLNELFTKEEFTEVWATWEFYQDIIAAYRDPNRTRGRACNRTFTATGAALAIHFIATVGPC